jgi:hypothetical protein
MTTFLDERRKRREQRERGAAAGPAV